MKTIIISILISFAFPVIGGWEVDPACPNCKYPFNVSLQAYPNSNILLELQNNLPVFWDGHFCQGSLIAPNWVLTTGDCVDIVEYSEDIWVELGLHNIYNSFDMADSIAVENIYFHPNYDSNPPCYEPNPYGCNYNYALLELSEESIYEPIQLISDSTYEELGDSVTVMGWGGSQVMGDGGWYAGVSWFMRTELYENNSTIGECLPGWSGYDDILCLTPFNIDDYDDWSFQNLLDPGFPGGACTGDEGASLIITNDNGDHELIGNFYLGCVLETTNQNKFTRTSLVKDWIYSYTGGPCFGGATIDISIIFDEYPDDISWEIWYKGQYPDEDYLYLVENGDLSDDRVCILDEGVYEFIIRDQNGDGLCCTSYPFGSYEVAIDTGDWNNPNEHIVVQGGVFGFSEATLFAWPDSDGDLIIDSQDIAPNNQFLCGDQNLDSCDDCSSGNFSLENNCNLVGDVNQDSNIDILDIVLIVNHVIGDISLNQNQLISADFNGDSLIDVLDIVQIVSIILNQ